MRKTKSAKWVYLRSCVAIVAILTMLFLVGCDKNKNKFSGEEKGTDEVEFNGETYVAIAPTEYYVLKKVKTGKKEDLYQPVDGKELESACEVFDKRINIINHDEN